MKLFEKFSMGCFGKTAFNRVALAPMTNTQSNADGTLGEDEFNWLVRRAEGKFGTIISCASHVSLDGQGWENQLGIYSDKHVSGLIKLAKGIHKYGSLAIIQLYHGGARSSKKITGRQPWSASAHVIPGKDPKQVREATAEDIQRVTEDFTNAAKRASIAGWDGVELHAAHGYLLHQFLSTETNKRKDKWGGSLENKLRLLFTIIKEIRKTVPAGFIIGIRLSPEDSANFKGIDFDDSLNMAEALAIPDVDYIHISAWEALKKPNKYQNKEKTIIEYFREVIPSNVMLMVAGEIWTKQQADKAIALGADCVAIGRAAIANPDWPKHAAGKDFNPIRPPYSAKLLRSKKVSDRFIIYLKNWKGFVKSPALIEAAH